MTVPISETSASIELRTKSEYFVKLFVGGMAEMVLFNRLSWDESSLLFRMLPFVDYETNVVLSPKCFTSRGRRTKYKYPASINEIIEHICQGKKRNTVIKILDSLEAKGLIRREGFEKGPGKYVVISDTVAAKGKKKAVKEI
jgi:hypothetical protein